MIGVYLQLKAVELLDKYIEKIILDLKIPILAIAGNHDSGERLGFMSSILRKQGFYIEGELKGEIDCVTLKDTYGDVDFYLISYGDSTVVREVYGDNTIRTHEDAMKR